MTSRPALPATVISGSHTPRSRYRLDLDCLHLRGHLAGGRVFRL